MRVAVFLLAALVCAASAQYQLAATQRNAIGAGAASATIGDFIYVVGGTGDETRGISDPQLTFL